MFILKNTLRLINIQCVKLKNNGEKKKDKTKQSQLYSKKYTDFLVKGVTTY